MNNYSNTRRPSYIKERKKRRVRRIIMLIVLITVLILVLFKKDIKNIFNPHTKTPTLSETDNNEKNVENGNNATATENNNDGNKENITENAQGSNEPTKQTGTTNETESNNSESTNTEATAKIIDGYNFSEPVPASDAVEETYFDDAVFIGNSRTEGVMLYSHPSKSTSYTHKGLMVNTIFTKPYINDNGTKITVIDAIKKAEFKKIYIMLGINETGWVSTDTFIEKYEEIVDAVKESHPDAIIYIQSILPVTAKLSSTHSYVKNSKIAEYNTRIAKMAEEKQVYYVNVAESVMDKNGCLYDDAAVDGIHLKKPYCEKWVEYLTTHTTEKIK
ncbi:hypothetical protein SH1V18_37540 [Vallitalea longa]|uniref:SGNH hydrolase-type esterase domain-containing protein n=1 Tax=Vallitalea longa TaxID=2936439 RepID=A0A9W5YDX7_9FIRM|nr:GDSL-type esterase/lipase family protein [Vallitalea longa]GKX31274.1 hypothetical protein SH1V18_37540 [Vallitalea longa]